MQQTQKKILLGIDLEEFDIPEEYGQGIDLESKISVTKKGLSVLLPILDAYSVKATFFTTAYWALHEQVIVQGLSKYHEIASHSFYHSSFRLEDLARSREILSGIIGKEVRGLRMPRMQSVNMRNIADAGYLYDSSLNPTWLPGRYNHLKKNRFIFKEQGIYEMPVSVSYPGRIPLFWLTIKNMPFPLYIRMARKVLTRMGYLIVYLHPWEFTDLRNYNLPWFIKRNSGDPMAIKLSRLLRSLSQTGDFETHSGLLATLSNLPK